MTTGSYVQWEPTQHPQTEIHDLRGAKQGPKVGIFLAKLFGTFALGRTRPLWSIDSRGAPDLV